MNDETTKLILSQTNFTIYDWLIVAVYLFISLIIGLRVKKYIRDMSDYITAGRSLGTCIGIATMTGTELGLITVMYSAQKGFVGGFSAFHIAVIAAVITFFVGLTGFIVVPLREMKVLTIPEYYERRFGRKTRILGGIMLALGGILNMGMFLKVGSMFIVGITGMSSNSWALTIVMVVLLILVLIYTALGGMVAVVITDYIQFVVLSFGLVLLVIMSINSIGWDHIFNTITVQMGEKGFNPLVEGEFGIEYVIWMVFLGLVGCGIWPTAVARALAAKSTDTVKKQYMWSSISYLIRLLIPYFLGICAFVYIMTKSPDLKQLFFQESKSSETISNLYALPIFISRVLPTGILGIISAAMIAAFMSTHDSYFLCWSSVITQDIIAPLSGNRLSVSGRIKLTRIIILLIGLYVLYWGLIYSGSEDIWDYMAVTGAIYFSGAFAVLVGGLYWKRASSTGAFLALLAGCTAVYGLEPVQKAVGFKIPGERVGLGCIVLTLLAMVIGSLLFPDKKEKTT